MTVFSIYAPIEEQNDGVKEQFYEQLAKEIESVPKYGSIIILGDFNAKTG